MSLGGSQNGGLGECESESNRSTVPTYYATHTTANHLYPLGNAGDERAPAIAWLRLWVYADQEARPYFYGDDCILCQAPWVNPQRKNWP
jgi:hypothetical protein